MPVACAVELLHTYSLIHDDLPCMDNDTLRRGKPTNHVVYGECGATLAGDALQADAFSTVLSAPIPDERKAKCALLLANAAGSEGMCAGQFLDTGCAGGVESLEDIRQMHALKTGALIAAACQMGVAAAGGSQEQMEAAGEYGRAIGLAFQIRDDMLDESATTQELGKNAHSDKRDGKTTFVTLLGVEGCCERVADLTEKAVKSLEMFEDAGFLTVLAKYLAGRKS
jgi:geranylgeranyl diphosphate synthase type II